MYSFQNHSNTVKWRAESCGNRLLWCRYEIDPKAGSGVGNVFGAAVFEAWNLRWLCAYRIIWFINLITGIGLILGLVL